MSTELPYEIEPELRFVIPRRACIQASSRATLRVLGWFTLIGVLLIVCFAARDLTDLYALRAHGVTKQAVITARREVHGKSTSYYLSYSLATQGVAIADQDQVPEWLYESKRVGDTLPVTFLPDHPQTHRSGPVGNERVRKSALKWSLGLLIWSGFFCLVLVGIGSEYRKELRLAQDGIPIAATITDCAAPTASNRTDYTITYRFLLPDGEQVRTCTVAGDVGKQLAAGKTVTALYDADNPRHSCLYCGLRNTMVE